MTSGLLTYTLGLTTSGFTGPLSGAISKLAALTAGALSLDKAIEGVQHAIEKGAGLAELSSRTGETIGNLDLVRLGLQGVGVDSEETGTMLFMLQKALGGINDEGQPTAEVFAQLKLSIASLKTLNAPQQILAIASAINKLDASSATAASEKIFGRFSAAQFLQVARNTREFSEALRNGAAQAATYDRMGKTFEELQIQTAQIKEHFSDIWLGVATGLAPAIAQISKSLSEIDFSKIGEGAATMVNGIIGAFKDGKLSDLIGDSLKLGFDSLLIYAPAVFEKIGFFLVKAFETPFLYIEAGLEYALEAAIHKFASSAAFATVAKTLFPTAGAIGEKLAQATGDPGAPDFATILKERQEEGLKFNLGTGEFGPAEMNDDAKQRMADATKQFLAKWKDFAAIITGFAKDAPIPEAAHKMGTATAHLSGVALSGGGSHHVEHKIERTALEKMGFVFRGAAGADPASQTAKNTARTASLLQRLIEIHGGSSPASQPIGGLMFNSTS